MTTSEKNTRIVIDALHAQMDRDAVVGSLLRYNCSETSPSVLEVLNAAVAPLCVGPLALMVDGDGVVIGVGVVRKPVDKSHPTKKTS